MAKVFEAIDERLAEWIGGQHVFFVATAPSGGSAGDAGYVNLSPKGLSCFRILAPTEVAYLDLVGSGAETIAHLRENHRITFMFCAFEGPPKILRLYGEGRVLEPGDAEFKTLRASFPPYQATRAIIHARLTRIADSCGYGVPKLAYQGERTQMRDWADRKGDEGIRRYQLLNNQTSIDGLPALRAETLGKLEGDP